MLNLKRMTNYSTMKHIQLTSFGEPSVMVLNQSSIPVFHLLITYFQQLKSNEVLMKVKATSINRADILQRKGKYPPPKGASEILGLEAAGLVNGQRYAALLSGGGYAEYVAVHKDHLIPLPDTFPFSEAGGIAESYLTSYLQLKLSKLKAGDSCLVYAAASGIGLSTLQLCKYFGITTIASCSAEKIDFVKQFTPFVLNRGLEFEEQIKQLKQITKNNGVDTVFDCIGQSFVNQTLSSLSFDGRWVLYGLLSGNKVKNFDFATLLGKRITLICTTLRSRSDNYKSCLVQNFNKEVLPAIVQGIIKPVIFDFKKVKWNEEAVNVIREFHTIMENNKNIGKLNIEFE